MKPSGDAATPEAKSHRRLLVLGVVLVGTPVLLCLPNLISGVLMWSPRIRAGNDVVSLHVALHEYAIANNGVYPSSLKQLLTPTTPGHYYLEDEAALIDPWKREYLYAAPTPTHPQPRVWSHGADGAPGGTGDDADIDSDKFKEVRR